MGLLSQKTYFQHDSNKKLGFGKYGNHRWSQVPEHYLDFIVVNFDQESDARKHASAEVNSRGIDHYKHLDED